MVHEGNNYLFELIQYLNFKIYLSFVILKICYEIKQNITLVLIWLSYAPICLLISFFIFSHLAFQNAFVGLKNLGATCYVNTFLQVRQFTADMKKVDHHFA